MWKGAVLALGLIAVVGNASSSDEQDGVVPLERGEKTKSISKMRQSDVLRASRCAQNSVARVYTLSEYDDLLSLVGIIDEQVDAKWNEADPVNSIRECIEGLLKVKVVEEYQGQLLCMISNRLQVAEDGRAEK